MPACIPSVRSCDFLLADLATLHETEPPVCTEEDRNLLADRATHASRGSEESLSSVSRHRGTSTPTRRSSFDQCSTVSDRSEPAQRNLGLKIGDKDSKPRVRRQRLRARKISDSDPTCYRYVGNCKNSRGTALGNEPFSVSAKGRGSDEILNPSKILNNFDLGGSGRGKGDFRDDQEQKRDCQYVPAGGRRDASKEDHEIYHTGSRKNDAKDCRVRTDCDLGERRGHCRHDHYEDRGTHRTQLSTSDRGKSGYCGNRWFKWREQESCDEWEKRSGSSDQRSVRDDCRCKDRHSDYPSYWCSLDSSSERQNDGPHRYRRSDFSPPDVPRGCGVAGRRKHRDYGLWPGIACNRKGYGTVGGHHKYPYYDYALLRSGYDYAYYGELYRTNPTYRQQVDAYYASLGYRTSHRMQAISVHSDIPCNYPYPRLDDSYISSSNYYYGPMIVDHMPHLEEVKKFPRPHPLARFCGVSGLLKLAPTVSDRHVPPPIEIHSLRNLFRNDPQFRELQAFPGPLVKSETHKDDVIHFCKDKIRSFDKDPILPDRSSRILLWELLLLMVRQNGFVSGSDIAELLVREHEPSESTGTASDLGNLPWYKEHAVNAGKSTENGDNTSPCEYTVPSDPVQLGPSGSNHTISKFREFLLYGRTKRALDWAAKHGLWGHALCLASKMDAQTFAAAVRRFTNSLPVSDPLRTLYQHLSVRQSTYVTCAAAERWGDWRPHLAMILSNPSSRPEVNARSIVTLGDALASRGCISAAHFCYLAARVEFGSFACKHSKLVLLGSCHQALSFREFASNEAIQATEIYEYARSLADAGYTLPHLQPYKFLLAMRLAEHGFAQEALHYCEVLAETMTRQCWSGQLATETYDLASRLKYHDAHFIQEQGELEELGDPPWLATFARIASDQLLQKTASGTVTQAADGFAHDNGYVGDSAQFAASVPSTDNVQGQIYLTPESSVLNANISDLQQEPEKHFISHVGASAYWNKWQAGTTSGGQPSPMLHATQDNVEQQPMSPSSLAAPPFVDYTKNSEPDVQWNLMPHATHDTVLYHPTSVSSFVAPLAPADDAGNMDPQMTIAVQPSSEYDNVGADAPFVSIESHAAAVNEPLHADTSAPSTTPASTAGACVAPLAPAENAGNMEPQMPIVVQSSTEYDRVRADAPSVSIESHAAAISEPLHAGTSAPSTTPASTEVDGFGSCKAYACSESQDPRRCWTPLEHLSDESSGKDASYQPDNARHSRQPSSQSLAESSGTGPAKDQGQATRKKKRLVDVIMGAFEKLVPKGPNQMILPDDTEPGIVWDDQKKCWVDKNAAPGEMDSRLAAPPLDSSFGDRSQNTRENRFQMNKHRRRRYVDVLNAVGNERSGDSAASSSVAPFLLQPAAAQAPAQFFVPGVSEQHDAGCDFVSPSAPLTGRTTPSLPPLKSPAPHNQPRAEATTMLTCDMA